MDGDSDFAAECSEFCAWTVRFDRFEDAGMLVLDSFGWPDDPGDAVVGCLEYLTS